VTIISTQIRKSKEEVLFNTFGTCIILIITILCTIPFILILSGSFTANSSIIKDGYHVIPKVFSLNAYKAIFAYPEGIIRAYCVTISTTLFGTLLGLFIISMAAYVLQRRDFKYRNKFAFFIYFTSIFGGGLIPWFIVITKYMHLQDSYMVLIWTGLMNPFLIILMRTFISISVPGEVIESAKIDGAGDFKIYYSIIIHLIGPGLATIGLFLALTYWNDWFSSAMFITTQEKYSLQFYLYNMLNRSNFMQQMSQSGITGVIEVPSESTKLAMSIVVIGPIIFLYPFVQKYFVKGITIGAVKG
jgi:putative aldouronate transport system permease protein